MVLQTKLTPGLHPGLRKECKAASGWLPVKSGVPQGTVLGPLMFLIYINDIGKNLSCCMRLFADDCLLYHIITSEEDCAKLQHDLNTIYKWSCTWQMKFNLSKCVTLKCYRSSSPIEIDYFINDHKVENVKHHPCLGITLDQTMLFIPHLNNITSKATRVLNFIKRNLSKCSQYTKSNAYFSLVRPSLEYASSIWDPYYNTHISTIKKIQRRAVRWKLNNYNRYSSVTAMLHDLKWPTLQYRQQRARLSLFYKSLNNLIALQIPSYYIPNRHPSRLHHQLSYIHPYVRTNAYIYSFFPRTIKEWNFLPTGVVTSNTYITSISSTARLFFT